MIIIRKATEGDLPTILELINELAHFEKEPDAVEITVETLLENGFGINPLFQIRVATQNNMIIGMALFYFRFSTWKGKTIHLEDLIVREDARGTGVGSKLYSEVMKTAFDENVKRVEWVVLDWNQNAIDFYNKTGAQVLQDWRTVQMDEQGLQKYIKTL
ncbi:GNAT family N-acetyltransferase [Myroides guanonis]|uniref:Predicted N-acetyltransferase YhbS n=1 Tax=Myroides guanonis TaxID=1150112 RepID=A0A1I3MQ64_9FLAO|nr:Predicted N-acetyltransferase YhbS [Myroides guanonis]